jgi:probable rRNA maturation factor
VAKVSFNYADRKLPLNQKQLIKKIVQIIFVEKKIELEHLNYVFCSDEYLLEINATFLQHDFYTDIITFNLSNVEKIIEGEIYISRDRVEENSRNYRVPLEEEFLRVIFHGALHLCGYGDKTLIEKKIMRAQENKYIKMFHVKQKKLDP